jgi:hypothetical protein
VANFLPYAYSRESKNAFGPKGKVKYVETAKFYLTFYDRLNRGLTYGDRIVMQRLDKLGQI